VFSTAQKDSRSAQKEAREGSLNQEPTTGSDLGEVVVGSLAGAESDRGDAKLLADRVHTDRRIHRQVVDDSLKAEGIKIMARKHQNQIWTRVRLSKQVRNAQGGLMEDSSPVDQDHLAGHEVAGR